MARYTSDQNKVLGIYESGTYGAVYGGGSGVFWVGQVTEHSIDDADNILENRYLGTGQRSVDMIELGPKDVTGTLTFNAQNMQMMAFAIGSIYSESGTTSSVNEGYATMIPTSIEQSPFTSGTGQLNNPISFTIEDSKQAPGTGRNFIRTVNGAVPNTVTLNAAQGEKVTLAVDYIGQGLAHSSGTTTTVIELTPRPYLWSDCSANFVDIDGSKSGLTTVKSVELSVNNNREGMHYLNGSREAVAPSTGNRDITISVTADLDADYADMLYHDYKNTGSKFNFEFDMNGDQPTIGSKHATFNLSGCWIRTMEVPSTNEGLTETTIEIGAGSINLIEYNNAFVSGLYHDGIQW